MYLCMIEKMFHLFCHRSKFDVPLSSCKNFARGAASDVVLWVIVLTCLVMSGLAWYSLGSGRFQRLHLTLRDANEIVAGSNVYFTGVHVGEVEDIILKTGGVQVSLKLHADTPPLPQALTAHIIFSGLAGTKQIHLWPKTDDALPVRIGHEKVADIDVESPIRFRDMLQANTDIAIALKSGADGMGKFLEGMYTDSDTPNLPIDPDDVVEKTDAGKLLIEQWNQDVAQVQRTVDELDLHQVNQNMQTMADGLEQLNEQSKQVLASQPLKTLHTKIHQVEAIAQPVHRKALGIQSVLQKLSRGAQKSSQLFQRFTSSAEQAKESLGEYPSP